MHVYPLIVEKTIILFIYTYPSVRSFDGPHFPEKVVDNVN